MKIDPRDGFSDLDLRVIDAEDAPNGKSGWFMTLTDTHYVDLEGNRYIVEAGFLTDLASIPFFLRWLFKKTGKSRKPALFHDHMYASKWKTRKECDDKFKEMLKRRSVNRVATPLYWSGVRVGGWTRGRW